MVSLISRGIFKMKFRGEDVKKNLAEFSFVLIVPFFLVYQYFVQFKYIPPVLGGYLTVGCVFASPFILMSQLIGFKYRRKPGDELKFGYLFFLFVVVFFSLFSLAFNADFSIVKTNLAGSFRSVVIFFVIIGFFNGRRGQGRWVLWFFILYSLMVIASSNSGSYIVRGLEISGDIFQIDYQSTAAFYILLLIYVAPLQKNRVRAFLYILSMYSLFMIGARSEMIGCLVVIMIAEFLLARYFHYYILIVGSGALTVGVGANYLHEKYSESRIFNFLSLDSDASMVARSNLNENAWVTISNNPLTGDFGSYEFGHYAHNVLSIWVDFGVAIFLYFVVLMFFLGYFLVKGYRGHSDDILYVRAASSYVMLLLMLAFAKNYMYVMIPVTVALFVVWMKSREKLFLDMK